MSTPIAIDVASLLVEVTADQGLDALETELAARGFTLGIALADAEASAGAGAGIAVGDWLARGAPGAPSLFADPADHLLAGLEATLISGDRLEVRPGPRRAVGPDLTALFVGAHRRFGSIDRAWLRIHRRDARRPSLPLPAGDLDPPVTEAEARLLEAIRSRLDDTSQTR